MHELELGAGLSAQHEQALLRPDEQLGHPATARDRRQDVQHVVVADGRLLPRPFAVVEHVHVLPDAPVLVEDPADDRRVRPLEGLQRLTDGRAADLYLR